MKNTIEIKNNTVEKTYASRIDFLREEKIYKMLQCSGLSPKLIESSDGKLIHEYVEGESLLDLLAKANGDLKLIASYFEMFYSWYAKFREITKMNLGQVRFEKLIVSDGKLCGIEFENCKPGFLEEDIARLAAQMCMIPESYSDYGIRMSRFFISVGAKSLSINPEMLSAQLSKFLEQECKAREIETRPDLNEYIVTLSCSTGIVFAGGQTPISDCTEPLEFNPQKIISVPDGKSKTVSAVPDFRIIVTSSGIDNTLSRIVETQKYADQVWSIILTTDMPRIPKILWDAQFSCDKTGCAAVVIKAGGKLREFPLLLNNSMTKLALKSALNEGEKSLMGALEKLPIRVIELESL